MGLSTAICIGPLRWTLSPTFGTTQQRLELTAADSLRLLRSVTLINRRLRLTGTPSAMLGWMDLADCTYKDTPFPILQGYFVGSKSNCIDPALESSL